MVTVKESIARLEAHERECVDRMKFIEKRLDEGGQKFRRLENMLWSVYPCMIAAIAMTKWL
jgi:hypothetical protein|tara:strand:+ start:117 stop:299 length:183 start_codon:yes stop_codon:yes gene_type:complete